ALRYAGWWGRGRLRLCRRGPWCRLLGRGKRAHLFGRVCLRLLKLFLGDKTVLVGIHLEELLDRVVGQLDAVELAVLVGVDLLELAHGELPADLVGRQALGLRPVARAGQRGVLLLAQLAVVVLVEPV